MNTMPDPTCPTCGDECAVQVFDDVLVFRCPRCEQHEARRREIEREKLAAWNAWAQAAFQRWLGLEGQELLDAVRLAADSGDEVTCKVQPAARQVRFLPLSTPPMFRGFEQDGSSDDR